MEDALDIKKIELKLNISNFFMIGMRIILSLLIVLLLTVMAGGLVRIASELPLYMNQEIEVALRKILIHVLMLLAMVEIFKTTMVYFSEGRVKVTFIVDTILIVILTESMSVWFNKEKLDNIFVLIALIIVLVITRIVAVRYSPNT